MIYHEVSALDGNNVENSFIEITKLIHDKY